MANYTPALGQKKSQYSLIDDPQFQSSFAIPQLESVYAEQSEAPIQAQEKFLSPDVAQATAYGAQSGGLSGALTSGGLTSLLSSGASTGNVAALGGGLILSQIEAAQKAKAAAEQESIANEKNRMEKTRLAYAGMANQRFGV